MIMRVFIKSLFLAIALMVFPVISGVIVIVFDLAAPLSYWVQGAFMLLSLVIPAILLRTQGPGLREIGFVRPARHSNRLVLYFLPLFVAKAAYFFFRRETSFEETFALIFFTFAIGLAEEVYFRGLILTWLKSCFSVKQAIFLSSVLFALVHASQALSGSGAILVILTVANAFIFGMLAALLVTLTGSLLPGFIWHSLYNFLNWTTTLQGTGALPFIVFETVCMILYGLYLWTKLSQEAVHGQEEESEFRTFS